MSTGLNFDIQEDAVGECYSGHDDDIGKVPLFCIKNLHHLLYTDGPPDPPLREPLQPPAEHEYVGISCHVSVRYNALLFQKADTSVNEDSLPGSM